MPVCCLVLLRAGHFGLDVRGYLRGATTARLMELVRKGVLQRLLLFAGNWANGLRGCCGKSMELGEPLPDNNCLEVGVPVANLPR